MKFGLEPNFPNPFNPETTINYQLAGNSYIDLSIYNMLGQKIKTLLSKKQKAGRYQITWNGDGIPSGVYVLRMMTDKGFSENRKLVLLK